MIEKFRKDVNFLYPISNLSTLIQRKLTWHAQDGCNWKAFLLDITSLKSDKF
jgi:hypothetical protein